VRVDHTQVEWSERRISISEYNKHRVVNDSVAGIDKSCRLESVPSVESVGSSIDSGRDQGAIRKVELIHPSDI